MSTAGLKETFGKLSRRQRTLAIKRELGRRRMSEFVKQMWSIHHRAPPAWNFHIDAICEHCEAVHRKEIEHLLISIQPGFLKSLLVAVYFPAWVWTHDSRAQFLCTGATDDVVFRDARRHQEVCASDTYQEIYRPRWTMLASQNAKGNFVNTDHGHRVSRTCGQSITGLRADFRIMDDPVDASKAYADKERIADINVWIDTVFLNRTNDPDSPMILIMQRIAEHDPCAHLLELKLPKTVHLNLPAEYDPKRAFVSPIIRRETGKPWTDQRETEGELLHPERFDAKAAETKKKDVITWSAQYQQDPTPAQGAIFRAESFGYWGFEPDPSRRVVQLPQSFDYTVISADFNNLKQRKAHRMTDFACIDVWGAAGRDRYLLRQIRQKLGVAASKEATLELIRQTEGLRAVLIEKSANGPSVISHVRGELGFDSEDNSFVIAVSVQGESKIQRAEAVNGIVTDGRVYIGDPEQFGDMSYWLQEITGFPARMRDDRVDTMTMALNYMEKLNAAPIWSMSMGDGKAH